MADPHIPSRTQNSVQIVRDLNNRKGGQNDYSDVYALYQTPFCFRKKWEAPRMCGITTETYKI
jgi:hypothetical protein